MHNAAGFYRAHRTLWARAELWIAAVSSSIPLPRLFFVGDIEEHHHTEACKQINQRSQELDSLLHHAAFRESIRYCTAPRRNSGQTPSHHRWELRQFMSQREPKP